MLYKEEIMIPVMNVQRQYASLQKELDDAALEVLHSGGYILGPKVADFESSLLSIAVQSMQ